MPGYKGHLLGGLFFYAVALALVSLYYISVPIGIHWLCATLAGALFPDIDTKSKGQYLFYQVFLVLAFTCVFYNKPWHALSISLFGFAPLLCKHRGLFHNFWFLLLVTLGAAQLLVYFFPEYKFLIITDALFFALGIFSHLWLDMGLARTLRFR